MPTSSNLHDRLTPYPSEQPHCHDDRDNYRLNPSLQGTPLTPSPIDSTFSHSRDSSISPPPAYSVSERPSPSRRRDPDHIPRPPNAFMIFRSEMCHRQKNVANAERDNRNISVIAGICWEKLTPAERKPYEHLAQIAKERHAAENPGYKYTPNLRKKPIKKRTRKDPENESERRERVALEWMKGLSLGDSVDNKEVASQPTTTSPPLPPLIPPSFNFPTSPGSRSMIAEPPSSADMFIDSPLHTLFAPSANMPSSEVHATGEMVNSEHFTPTYWDPALWTQPESPNALFFPPSDFYTGDGAFNTASAGLVAASSPNAYSPTETIDTFLLCQQPTSLDNESIWASTFELPLDFGYNPYSGNHCTIISTDTAADTAHYISDFEFQTYSSEF